MAKKLLKWLFLKLFNFQEDKLRYLRIYIVVSLRYLFAKKVILREHLPVILTLHGLRGEGVEIGVLKGSFSDFILKYSRLCKLHSIDIWEGELQRKRYEIACNILRKYGDRSNILWMNSAEAAKFFKQNTLDFVHIDADHSYESCKQDIELWWPKLKNKGVFSGDDYEGSVEKSWGVKTAVDEFAQKNKHSVCCIYEKSGHSWWWLVKNAQISRLAILVNFLKGLFSN